MASISIIMSFYNAGPYLKECLDSILNQSVNDWELIAVNNFATDNSRAIVKEYAQLDGRVKLLDNKNEGIIQALQMGFEHAKGEWITRMDADDIMPQNKLEKLRGALIHSGKGFVSTGLVHYFSHEGEVGNGYKRYEAWLNELTRKEENFKDIYKECVIPSPCWMTHRVDLMRAGAFDPHVYPEDYDLCFRFYKAGLKVVGVPEVLHQWRDYPSRTSRTDERYANPFYFQIKLPYFIELELKERNQLVLWGAGRKGKELAKMLINEKLSFTWITDNALKHEHNIYGVTVKAPEVLDEINQPRVIIAVAIPEAQIEIEAFLKEKGMEKGEDYYFFC